MTEKELYQAAGAQGFPHDPEIKRSWLMFLKITKMGFLRLLNLLQNSISLHLTVFNNPSSTDVQIIMDARSA